MGAPIYLEVERRAALTVAQYETLARVLEQQPDYHEEDRLVFDYGAFVAQQGVDRRVRSINGQTEVIEKFKAEGAIGAREVITPQPTLQAGVEFLLAKGYDRAHVIRRLIKRATYQGMEFSLNIFCDMHQASRAWGYLVEAELMVEDADAAGAQDRVDEMLASLGLQAMEKPLFKQWVDDCRNQATIVVDCRDPEAVASL